MPGDRVEIRRGIVIVNGAALTEPYRNDPPDPSDDYGPVTVPAKSYFVLGDNRDDSYDSRYWGFVPESNIIGTPVFIYMSVEASDDAWQPGQVRERFYAYANALLHPRSGALASPVQVFLDLEERALLQRREQSSGMRYADAGVDIARADQAKERIRRMASRTFTKSVLGGIGAFGALFALDLKRWREPVLVSSADGVGTKLKVAAATGVHSTVGADLVNHCVNDILTLGAEPLFFLDYLAMGRIDPDVVEQLVEGMTRACHQAGCALVGGETAELPGHLRARRIRSCGIHRGRGRAQQYAQDQRRALRRPFAGAALARTAYQWLLPGAQAGFRSRRTRARHLRRRSRQQNRRRTAHAAPLLLALAQERHRPGLGLRPWRTSPAAAFPAICRACCRAACRPSSNWVPGRCCRSFRYLAGLGRLERDELLRTFNLGVGMILVVPPAHLRAVESELKRRREKFYRIGEVRTADPRKPPIVFTGSLPL